MIPEHHLFFAVMPDPDTAARIAGMDRWLHSEMHVKARMLRTEHLHITLHSLGNFVRVPEMFLARARAAAATIDVPPFGVTLDQISSFRRKERRWPLVLTGSFGMDPLADFQRKLGDALRAASLRISSARFKPHLTLLYDEGSVEQRAIEPITWTVSELVLIDSWLGKTHYDVKGRWPLKGTSPSV